MDKSIQQKQVKLIATPELLEKIAGRLTPPPATTKDSAYPTLSELLRRGKGAFSVHRFNHKKPL
jgi:hypothetical protein